MQEYKDYLRTSLQSYFNIEENFMLGQENFDLYATFNQRHAKYMLLRDVEIYAFKSNEYIFLKKMNRQMTLKDLDWLKEFLEKNLNDIVVYDEEHMSSVVTVIFEAPMPSLEVQKKIAKFKYYKSFSFGLKGWVNAKVMLIDPALNSGITNKLGKGDLQKFVMN